MQIAHVSLVPSHSAQHTATSPPSFLYCFPLPAAVQRGRELRADYKLVARAMTRKGNALVKQGKLEEAVQVYQKSLTEHR